MTNDDADAEIRALEEKLAKAKAQAKIKALQDEIDALGGSSEPATAVAEVQPAAAAPVVAPLVMDEPLAAEPRERVVYVDAPAKARKGGLVAALLVLLVLLLATLTATYFAVRGDIRGPWAAPAAPPTDLTLIPAGQFGPNPFLAEDDPNYVLYNTLSLATTESLPDPADSLSITEVAGDTPEIYGLGAGACRTPAIVEFLEGDADRGAAWTAALNTDPTLGFDGEVTAAGSEAFISNLVIGVLLGDTRVTFNGYASGAIFPTQAVLQKGTIVLVDRFGVPRVHCLTGAPLTASIGASSGTVFSGVAWDDFSVDSLVRISPSASVLSELTVLPVGDSNVDTPLTLAIGTCVAGESCEAPSASDTYVTDPTPTVSPTPGECSNLADGLTEDDWIPFRLLNATSTAAVIFTAGTPAEGCGATWFTTLLPGQGASSRGAPGLFWITTDGTTATETSTFVLPTEPTLWVIQ